MTLVEGASRKLIGELRDDSVNYYWPLGNERVALNPLIGQTIVIESVGAIHCVACNRVIKKTYNNGYCFPCVQTLAECDLCIVKPELCHYDQGTCRQSEWGEAHCIQPHVVYLAYTSGVKVGITRQRNIPTRWIDQGAVCAIPIYHVSSRYLAGLIEVKIAQQLADKTNWRRMLQDVSVDIDLLALKQQVIAEYQGHVNQLVESRADFNVDIADDPVVNLVYPVDQYPAKITSLNLDKTPQITGQLQGVKGQYLIFDCGVINIRKYSGYTMKVIYP